MFAVAKKNSQASLRDALRSFVTERHPFGLAAVLGVFDTVKAHGDLEQVRAQMRQALPDVIRTQLTKDAWPAVDTTPGTGSDTRANQAATCRGRGRFPCAHGYRAVVQ